MPDEPIHDRIAALRARTPAQTVALVSQVLRTCEQDSSRPAARDWVRLWRPERAAIAVVAECTCRTGHCDICN